MKLDLSGLTLGQRNSIRYQGYKPVCLYGEYAIGAARTKKGAALVVCREAQAESNQEFTADNVVELEDRFVV